MSSNPLTITKKDTMRGVDGYKIFSVRIKNTTVRELDLLSSKTNRSRNELINILLEYAVSNCRLEE